uniref:Uncharacterized protein n=1 Tax=Ditylenchus dipsaci TaxID=166011 RepID=A0A915DQJ5_9BILA
MLFESTEKYKPKSNIDSFTCDVLCLVSDKKISYFTHLDHHLKPECRIWSRSSWSSNSRGLLELQMQELVWQQVVLESEG